MKMLTARPWVAGGTLSEGDESEEENVEKLQGIIRFSFPLLKKKTLKDSLFFF